MNQPPKRYDTDSLFLGCSSIVVALIVCITAYKMLQLWLESLR